MQTPSTITVNDFNHLKMSQAAQLTATLPYTNDLYGSVVAVSGDIAVVGAVSYDGGGANSDTGAVFVYYRNLGAADNWALAKIITPTSAPPGEQLGTAAAINGDTIVVGARQINTSYVGAAYVYSRNQGGLNNWGLVKKLVVTETLPSFSFFGSAVSIFGDTVVVGAPSLSGAGAAYIFERNQGGADNWGQVQKLAGSGAERLGTAVGIDGDTLVVGASNGGIDQGGIAYVYERNLDGPDNWGKRRGLGPLTTSQQHFGTSVAISGDTIAVGSDNGSWTYPVYVYGRHDSGFNNWGRVQTVYDSGGATNFGYSLALQGDVLVIGAPNIGRIGTGRGQAEVHERNQGGADNWGLSYTVQADDGIVGDDFGASVAVHGNLILIGARQAATLGYSHSGAAYLFKRTGSVWNPIAYPTASDGAAADNFGSATALYDDLLVVGAPNANAAYLYARNTGSAEAWGQVAILSSPDSAAGDRFGAAVALDNNTIIVGAPNRNGSQGTVYIFERVFAAFGEWTVTRVLSGTAAGDKFGYAVSLSGDRLAIGAPGATSSQGLVSVHERNKNGAEAWGAIQSIPGSATGDQFGYAISLDIDTLLAGAPYADTPSRADAGSATVLERNTNTADQWGTVKTLTSTTSAASDHFGWSVSLYDDTALVGAPDADGGEQDTGAAYVFLRHQGGANSWGFRKALTDTLASALDRFGFAVSVHIDTALIGVPRAPVNGVVNHGQGAIFERNINGTDQWGLSQRLITTGAAEDRWGYSVALGPRFLALGALNANPGGNDNQGQAVVFRWGPRYVDLPLIRR